MHVRLTVLTSPFKPQLIGTFTNGLLDVAHFRLFLVHSPQFSEANDDRGSPKGELPRRCVEKLQVSWRFSSLLSLFSLRAHHAQTVTNDAIGPIARSKGFG
jgi:hypothetical protein